MTLPWKGKTQYQVHVETLELAARTCVDATSAARIRALSPAPHPEPARLHPIASETSDDLVPRASEAAPGTIGIQEAWEVAGGNPGIKATREDLLIALRDLDAVADEVPPKSEAAPVAVSDTVKDALDEATAAQADGREPIVWISAEQLHQAVELTSDAWVYWRESGHVAEPDEIPLFVGTVDEATPVPTPQPAPQPNGYLYPYGSDKTIVQFTEGSKRWSLDPIAAVLLWRAGGCGDEAADRCSARCSESGARTMSMDIAQAIQLIASNLHRSANHRSVTVRRDALATLFREYELLRSQTALDAAKGELK
jgi:hypothetical protein